jgi:hypothetical protein
MVSFLYFISLRFFGFRSLMMIYVSSGFDGCGGG